MWTYRLRYVKCGKHGCWCSSAAYGTTWADSGHGPYWYGYEHRGGRVYSRYFGKRPSSTFVPPPPEDRTYDPPPVDGRWDYHGRMDLRTALRIFGVTQVPNRQTLVAHYRVLANEHHPDHGGSNSIMAAINAAYAY